MSGSNIEITHYGRAIEKVVVGRIEKLRSIRCGQTFGLLGRHRSG